MLFFVCFFPDLNMEFNPSDHPRASTIFLSKSQTDGRLLNLLLYLLLQLSLCQNACDSYWINNSPPSKKEAFIGTVWELKEIKLMSILSELVLEGHTEVVSSSLSWIMLNIIIIKNVFPKCKIFCATMFFCLFFF